MVSLPIPLSADYTILVKKNDTVKSGQVIASRTLSHVKVVSLSEALALNPHKVGKYVKVHPGDKVDKDDVLALQKSLFRETKVLSELSGTVVSFERDTGDLHIQPDGTTGGAVEELRSPIDGIVSLCNNEQIVIQTDKDVLLGEEGVGKTSEADMQVIALPEDTNPNIYLSVLDTKVIAKIVALPTINRDVLLKAIGIGVEGVITIGLDRGEKEYLAKRNIKTPVISVSNETFKKLVKWNSKKVYLDGEAKTILLLHA